MIDEELMTPVSEVERLREQLLQAQKLSSVGALASSVAHEFNNILTTIINYAKLALRNPADEANCRASLEKILKGGHRASTIIKSMLGFARNNSNERKWTDLGALVEDVLVLTEKDLSKHQIRLEKTIEGTPHAEVIPAYIEQVVLNLAINARQAMPNKGVLRVKVRENGKTNMVEIGISDTGVGIAPDKLRRIFDPFYSSKTPDENSTGGTGLGLSICRQLIEQHQGRIRVESMVGRGSTFTIKLPIHATTVEM